MRTGRKVGRQAQSGWRRRIDRPDSKIGKPRGTANPTGRKPRSECLNFVSELRGQAMTPLQLAPDSTRRRTGLCEDVEHLTVLPQARDHHRNGPRGKAGVREKTEVIGGSARLDRALQLVPAAEEREDGLILAARTRLLDRTDLAVADVEHLAEPTKRFREHSPAGDDVDRRLEDRRIHRQTDRRQHHEWGAAGTRLVSEGRCPFGCYLSQLVQTLGPQDEDPPRRVFSQ